MMPFFHLLYYLLLLLFMWSCGENSNASDKDGAPTNPQAQAIINQNTGYRLDQPDQIYTLPGSLKEISGMQSISPTLVACTQDEDGIVYLFDLEQRKVVQEIDWGKGGDYEGIAGDSAVLYVLESNGTISQLSNYASAGGKPVVESWKTGIDGGCDAEGLFLLTEEKQLLIACKEKGDAPGGVRNIWAYSLQKKQLLPEPYRKIEHELLEEVLVTDGIDKLSLGLKKFLDTAGESGVISPSGIAIHPNTQDLFVVSAKSGLLVVLSPEGQVKSLEELPRSLYPQPESITFTSQGDLLIGNEGKGGDPNILFFKYDAQQ